MRFLRRRERPPELVVTRADLPRGETVLAFGVDHDRFLLGTRAALIVLEPGADPVRLRWEQVQAADWDRDAEMLTVAEVGEYGRPRSTYTFSFENPSLLLQLIRERVTASVILQRGYLVTDRKGFKVIGRRAPEGGPISWMHEYDAGVDPEDPSVREAAAQALARARADVGED